MSLVGSTWNIGWERELILLACLVLLVLCCEEGVCKIIVSCSLIRYEIDRHWGERIVRRKFSNQAVVSKVSYSTVLNTDPASHFYNVD